MLKDCGEDGKHRKMKAIFLMLGAFVLSFFISSVQVLILAFFGIFFTISAKKLAKYKKNTYFCKKIILKTER